MEGKRVLIAEGDSWFRFGPIAVDILDRLEKLGYEVRSVAYQGDLLKEMVCQFDGNGGLKGELEKIKQERKKPSAILLSGGGNDFAGKGENDKYRLEPLLNPANSSDVLNEEKVAEVIDVYLYDLYKKLIGKIDDACQNISEEAIPILIHGYGYVVPDGRGAGSEAISNARMWGLPGGDIGPWLQPAFHKKGHYDLEKNTAEMGTLIDRFNQMIKNLVNLQHFNHVKIKHVDLRACLSNSLEWKGRLQEYKKDWADELHPTAQAFKKIAEELDTAILDKAVGPTGKGIHVED